MLCFELWPGMLCYEMACDGLSWAAWTVWSVFICDVYVLCMFGCWYELPSLCYVYVMVCNYLLWYALPCPAHPCLNLVCYVIVFECVSSFCDVMLCYVVCDGLFNYVLVCHVLCSLMLCHVLFPVMWLSLGILVCYVMVCVVVLCGVLWSVLFWFMVCCVWFSSLVCYVLACYDIVWYCVCYVFSGLPCSVLRDLICPVVCDVMFWTCMLSDVLYVLMWPL